MADGFRLLFQTLRLQGSHPGMHLQLRQFWYHLVTRRITVGFDQFLVVFTDVLRHIELHLRKKLSLSILHIGIHFAYHVEYHIVIPRVTVVVVQIPVAGLVMDLDIAHPKHMVDLYLGIKEVGSCIAIVQA